MHSGGVCPWLAAYLMDLQQQPYLTDLTSLDGGGDMR